MNPNSPASTFGERLRELRLATGKSQQAVATAVGVGFPYISKLEKATGPKPTSEMILKLAAALELDEPATTELFALTERLPPVVEQLIVKEPDAMDFYRVAHRRLSEDQRRDFFRSLIDKLENEAENASEPDSQHRPPTDGEEG